VTDTVALRAAPAAVVAVTVTWKVVGGCVTWLLELVEPPPQPLIPNANTPTAKSELPMRVLRRNTGASRHSPTNPTPEPLVQPVRDAARVAFLADAFEVEIVMVSVAMSVPSGVREGGAKVQLSPEGSPEHANVTA
jgi:hypothetical protein